MLIDLQASTGHKLEEALRVRYGYHLFASEDIHQAMAQIGISASASPLVLLNLLPSLTPPSVLEPLELLLEDMVAGAESYTYSSHQELCRFHATPYHLQDICELLACSYCMQLQFVLLAQCRDMKHCTA